MEEAEADYMIVVKRKNESIMTQQLIQLGLYKGKCKFYVKQNPGIMDKLDSFIDDVYTTVLCKRKIVRNLLKKGE